MFFDFQASALVNDKDDDNILTMQKSLEDISVELNRLSSVEREIGLTLKSALDVHQQLEVNLGKVEMKWRQIRAKVGMGEVKLYGEW